MAQSDYDVNPTRMTVNESAVMPQDPEAEASVLSAMMVSAEALQECLIDLEPDDFYFPSNRTVFTTMREMFDKNMPIDTISLADYLKSSGELERVGGRSFLLGLGNNSLALVGWRRHIEMLHRDTTLRKMISASAQITALAYDAPEDTKEVVDRAERMLLDVTNRSTPPTTTARSASSRASSASTTVCSACGPARWSSSARAPAWARPPSRSTS